MHLRLFRDAFFSDATLGTLETDGLVFQTLEDVDRHLEANPEAKIHGQTAIPRGTYRLTLSWSPRFARILPRLLDVPGFSGVLIHAGNTSADTAGCVLVGEERHTTKILRSREALHRLMVLLAIAQQKGETIEIEIA